MASALPSGLLGSLTRQPPSVFTPVERELVISVLEDCVDQLSVLGSIMPVTDKPSAATDILGEELSAILDHQQQLEEQFDQLTLNKSSRHGTALPHGTQEEIHGLSTSVHASRNHKAVAESMHKLERDREFLEVVAAGTFKEMGTRGTFDVLTSCISECKEEKRNMECAILREQECARKVKELKKQFSNLRKQRETEITRLDQQIAHLKDQYQELKARTGLETNYLNKQIQVQVQCDQRRNQLAGGQSSDVKEKVQQQLEEEKRAHDEIESYLKKHVEDLEGKVEYWMAHYEEDLEIKTSEVQDLKSAKSLALQKLDDMSQTYQEYEEVVVEHRAVKEKQRRKAEQDKKENQTATRLQAWWRGVMVRKCLGPYSKGKKKKGKGKKGKGKKGKKGKKKK